MRRAEKGGKEPLYRRISEDIRRDILTGIYLPGEILPSIREEAAARGAARNTIELAYQLLAEEGYIRSKKGIGFEVLDCAQSFNYEGEYEKKDQGNDQGSQNRPQVFQHDFRAAVFIGAFLTQAEWKSIVLGVYQQKENQDVPYDLPLRKQVRRYLRKHRGISCMEEQIFMFRSLPQAMQVISRVQPHLLYTVPHHEGKLGNHISREEEKVLLARIREKGIYIMEDDIDGELVYGRQPYHTLFGEDSEGRVIFTGTLEQVLGGFLQMQYVVLPESLVGKQNLLFREGKQENRHSFLEIQILGTLMRSDRWENYLRRVNYRLSQKRDLMIEKLKLYFGRDTELHRTESGTEITAVIPFSGEEKELRSRAGKAGLGVLMRGGAGRKPVKMYVTLNYAAVTEEQIDTGLKELARIFNSLSAGKR